MTKILKFKTNINCKSCLAVITPYLNSESRIKEWKVDLKNSNKILTTKVDEINEKDIINILSNAGYRGELILKLDE